MSTHYPGWNEIRNNNYNQNQNTWSSIANNQVKPNSTQNQFSLQYGLQNFGEIQNRIGTYLSSTSLNEQSANFNNENTKPNNNPNNIQERMRQNFLLKPDISYFNQQQQQQDQNSMPNEQNLLQGLVLKPNLISPPNNMHDSFIADALIKSNPLLNSSSKTNPTSPLKSQHHSNDNIVKEYEREIALQDGTYNMLNEQNSNIPGIDELFKSAAQVKTQPTWQHTQVVRNFDDYDGPTSPVSNNNKSETSEGNDEFSRRRGG